VTPKRETISPTPTMFRTAFYLEQLSETMQLELSSTKPSAAKIRTTRAQLAAADGSSVKRGGKAASSSEDSREEISKIVLARVNGQNLPRSLAQLSGGERRRVALALALGFADLIRTRGRLSSNLLVLDGKLMTANCIRGLLTSLSDVEHDDLSELKCHFIGLLLLQRPCNSWMVRDVPEWQPCSEGFHMTLCLWWGRPIRTSLRSSMS
jgi:hypothetical protein